MASFLEGQHVVARKEFRAGFFGYPIRKGTRGVVLQRPVGIFSDKYVVSFPSGRVSVSGRHLKPTLLSPGNNLSAGIRLGWWIFLLIPLIGVARYLLAGGSVVGLIAAAPGAIVGTVVGLITRAADRLGLPVFLIGLVCAWLVLRHFKRR